MDEKLHLIAELLDLLSGYGHYDDSYCETCDRHAPKNNAGEITGDIRHAAECPIGRAAAVIDTYSNTVAMSV